LRALTRHSFICFRADQSADEKERQDRVQGNQPRLKAANEFSYPSSARAATGQAAAPASSDMNSRRIIPFLLGER